MSLLITNAGIAASIHAGELGVSYKITHIAIGLDGYLPTLDQTQLKNEVAREALTRGSVPALGQLHFEAVFADKKEFEGKEIGYYLEDGTLFAVDSREGEILSLKRSNTIITEALELNLAGSSIENITVELMGTPYATEEVAGIAKIITNAEVDEGTNDSSFLTIKKMIRAFDAPYLINKLVNNLWLKLAANIFPVGAAIPWFTEIAPDGFGIMKNQAFDLIANPELAKIWPDGIIPDMRGCGVMGKEDGETIGAYEEGQVKEHGHPNSVASSTDLGTKATSTDTHHHTETQWYGTTGGNVAYGGNSSNRSAYRTLNTSSDSHYHTVAIGSHAHAVMIALFGALKNTINHRKVNWIVRMA
ncbi:phage tail protein [Aliivibrio logei]|uniref:Phage tail protein n=1 Tax=Aliivibrio logei 5S-186 TaxID=626086 RepID=A0ABX3AX90_ALILO|nr:phage tail protein [Aliivibrio logei]OEF17046.1 phage tail protein [Aliivibrio logei 5S-186]